MSCLTRVFVFLIVYLCLFYDVCSGMAALDAK